MMIFLFKDAFGQLSFSWTSKMAHTEMKHSFFCALISSVLISCVHTERDRRNNGPNCANSLQRLERAVTNLTWDLKLTKSDLQSLKVSQQLAEVKLQSALREFTNFTKISGLNSEVSFQVKQIKHPYTVGKDEPLKFDDVTLNKGGAYNPTSGIFTVPTTGTYLCWANVMCNQIIVFKLSLIKEGQVLVRGYTGYNQGNGVATITYMAELKEGEHVWFALVEDSTREIHGFNYSSYGCHLMNT